MPILFNMGCRGIATAGFPIRKSPDHCLLAAPRSLSQLRHVLHRLSTPRHPPEALSSLTKLVYTKRYAPDFAIFSCQRSQKNQKPGSKARFHSLVEITGLEPVTFCVQGRCSPKLSYIPGVHAHLGRPESKPRAPFRDSTSSPQLYLFASTSFNGLRWIRTTDLSVISRMLCQLSYKPAIQRTASSPQEQDCCRSSSKR